MIDSEQSKIWLENAVSISTQSLDFCSAFITLASLRHFNGCFQNKGFSGPIRLLARWQLSDLLSGASDTASYEYAASEGIRFFVNLDFHGKVYSVNPGGVLIGSANLTSAGFSLKKDSNGEVCVPLNDNEQNTRFVDNLFLNATEIDNSKYLKIKSALESIAASKASSDIHDWPEDILNLFSADEDASNLIVDEMFHTKYSEISKSENESYEKIHDASLLGITTKYLAERTIVRNKFLGSKSYIWLIQKLEHANGVIYFGELTASLHNDLLDDPAPYRKDVKGLLQNLLDWAEEFAQGYIKIDRPNHSQRIALIKP